MNDPEFGKRFTELMEKRNIKYMKLTELAKISKNNITNYKNGQIPNATILYRLSQILGTSMEYMITGKEKEELTPEEQQLIDYYRNTNNIGQQSTLNMAKTNSELMPAELRSSISEIG